MNLLITILQAAHCRSTHHYFVLDALPLVTTPRGRLLRRVLLKHYDQYLVGAKDPDTRFRDFRNHVLHVQDGYWGGAMKKAEIWYRNLIEDLNASRWSEAAYSAGVLSHYFTDPVMPLHTAQSERESVVHRPLEWSVVKSYARIHQRWLAGQHKIVFELAQGKGWLSQAIKNSAQVANRYYEELIDRYDLPAGVKKPTAGIDDPSIDILAGLFGLATTGWARVLERAAEESEAAIPRVMLTPATFLATIKMPTAWILKRIESHQERQAVQAIFAEFESTGTVKQNLPAEVQEVQAARQQDRLHEAAEPPAANRDVSAPRVDPAAAKPAIPQLASPSETLSAGVVNPAIAPPVAQRTNTTGTDRQPTLQLSDDLVDAPSIGPKTAKRFAAIGITTVAQFLSAAPEQMERALATTWITAEKLADWQTQAHLVCTIASLCGYKSQLLVAVGVDSAEALAAKDPQALRHELERVAASTAGRRILRSSKVPERDEINVWIADATAVAGRKVSA